MYLFRLQGLPLALPADALTITDAPQTPDDAARQAALRAAGPLPTHVACIMDGNGRWAQRRGLPRVAGHREGVASVRDITEACAQLGVRYLTLYAFSTENWQRPRNEVSALMELLVGTLRKEIERLQENDIRLTTIGDIDQLPERCAAELREAAALTCANARMSLNLALSYSGRSELVRAMRQIAARVRAGALDPGAIDEAAIAAHLDTAGMPDPDLLIRTGGEMRISNFLLWQLAYTELYVSDLYWPAFRREALYRAFEDFQRRERRFGRVLLAEADR